MIEDINNNDDNNMSNKSRSVLKINKVITRLDRRIYKHD